MGGSSSLERLQQLQAFKRNSLLGSLGGSMGLQATENATGVAGDPNMNDQSSLARLQQLQQTMGGFGMNPNKHGNLNDSSALGVGTGMDLSQLRSQLTQQANNGGELDPMARLQQQLRNAGATGDSASLAKQLTQNSLLSTVMNNPNSSQASSAGIGAGLMGGGQMNQVNQMILLQQLGMDPTPRRESLATAGGSSTGGGTQEQSVPQQQEQQQQQTPDMNQLLQQYLARSSNAESSNFADV